MIILLVGRLNLCILRSQFGLVDLFCKLLNGLTLVGNLGARDEFFLERIVNLYPLSFERIIHRLGQRNFSEVPLALPIHVVEHLAGFWSHLRFGARLINHRIIGNI